MKHSTKKRASIIALAAFVSCVTILGSYKEARAEWAFQPDNSVGYTTNTQATFTATAPVTETENAWAYWSDVVSTGSPDPTTNADAPSICASLPQQMNLMGSTTTYGANGCNSQSSAPAPYYYPVYSMAVANNQLVYGCLVSNGTSVASIDIQSGSSYTFSGGFTFGGRKWYGDSSHNAYGILYNDPNCNVGGTGIPMEPGHVYRTDTRIDTVTPAGNSQVATSSAFIFAATGYLNPADLTPPDWLGNNNDTLTISWQENQLAACKGVDVIQALDCGQAFTNQGPTGTYNYPLVSAGPFSFSTTTNIQDQGDYTLKVSIKKPGGSFLGFNFWSDTLVSTTTLFTVASTTGFNDLQRAFGAAVTALGTASSTPVDLNVCNPVNVTKFDLNKCAAGLFVPQSSDITNDINNLQDGAFSRAPWGYVYRFINIINGLSTTTSTSSLPIYTVTFMTGPGDGQGATSTLTYDPGDMIAGGAELLNTIHDPVTGKNMQDIMGPYVQLTVALGVVFFIVNDILGLAHIGRGGGNRYKRPEQVVKK